MIGIHGTKMNGNPTLIVGVEIPANDTACSVIVLASDIRAHRILVQIVIVFLLPW